MKQRTESIARRPVIRVLVTWGISALAFLVMDWLMDSIHLEGLGTSLAVVFSVSLLNALFWPLLSRLLLPFAILTGGLLFLALNGIIIWVAARLIPGFEVADLWSATLLSIGVTAINGILSTLLTIDDDAPYYRNVIRKRMRRSKRFVETDVPGILFLEIDGLARPVLEEAMAAGYAPTMKRWLDEGSHTLLGWETDLSSQTSASQAGLLHGNNYNIPAFRWYDRERQKIVASSNPDEVASLEKAISDGNGLLVRDGASRGNLLSGDAPNVMNTASTIKDLSRFHTGDYYAFFATPYNFSRTLLLFLWDVVLERYRFHQQRRHNVSPRLDRRHRSRKYALIRGATTVLMRELSIHALIGDMFAGVPSAYATFVGYDEVAHHSGLETHDAFDTLYKIDQQFARLERTARQAPRPYHFVILSDHGQSGGATFKQRYGKTLAELVQELTRQHRVQGFEETNEGASNLNTLLTEAMQHETRATARRAAEAAKRLTVDEELADSPGEQVLSAEDVKGDEL
ncbi:MAG: phage holin family protein, partial [Anaerolineae bacterium]